MPQSGGISCDILFRRYGARNEDSYMPVHMNYPGEGAFVRGGIGGGETSYLNEIYDCV